VAFERSERLKKLPPYLFIEIDKKKKAAKAAGVDLVDLGVGDPDKPTPKVLIKALAKASLKPENHQYPFGSGMPAFRDAIATWFQRRFGVKLDPTNEVCATIGSKEAIGHFPLAFVNPGEVVLCPDPGYPVYEASTNFVGGEIVRMPLLEKNDFLPDLGAIPADALKRAKLMWLNSPNNPTAAVAPLDYLARAVEFCRKHGIILAHDMAYSEIYYDNKRPASVLEVEGAKDVAIEFHSLSKTFNMTGWRVGFAVGNPDLVGGLAAVKGNLDSGVVSAIQEMAIAALRAPASLSAGIRKTYVKRRALMVKALKAAGFVVRAPDAAFYLWVKVPQGRGSSAEFCSDLLEKAGIVSTPGNGFGPSGEGYFRLTLTAPDTRLKLAAKRLAAYAKSGR
jgi:LL-diaminopimelate aminotransferase